MNNGSSLRRPIRINCWSYDHDKVYICRFWGIFLEQMTENVNMIFLSCREHLELFFIRAQKHAYCSVSSARDHHLAISTSRGATRFILSAPEIACIHCILWVCSALHTVLTRENLSPRKTHCTSDCQHQSASLKCHLQYMAFI